MKIVSMKRKQGEEEKELLGSKMVPSLSMTLRNTGPGRAVSCLSRLITISRGNV